MIGMVGLLSTFTIITMTNKLPPKVGHILKLAAIIREVNGSHSLGASALAEAILDHHWVKEVKFSIEDSYED